MENLQRAIMLLKPDAHVAGQWGNGAALRLAAMPGGVTLSLQGTVNLGEGCVLALFSQNGLFLSEYALSGTALQVRAAGVKIDEIAGAAIICGDKFLLKSSGLTWPDIIARYRFAHARPAAPPELEPAEPENVTELSPAEPEAMPEGSDATSAPPEAVMPEEINLHGQADAMQPGDTLPAHQPEEACPTGIRQSPVDPFPGVFPGSEWVKISYPGPAGWWHYIFGKTQVEGYEADVVGVPGDYSMAPPAWLDGFSTYVRCSSGDARGYWLMFQDAQTGQVLDINRFRHGG